MEQEMKAADLALAISMARAFSKPADPHELQQRAREKAAQERKDRYNKGGVPQRFPKKKKKK